MSEQRENRFADAVARARRIDEENLAKAKAEAAAEAEAAAQASASADAEAAESVSQEVDANSQATDAPAAPTASEELAVTDETGEAAEGVEAPEAAEAVETPAVVAENATDIGATDAGSTDEDAATEEATPASPSTSGSNRVIGAGEEQRGPASVEEGITIAQAAARLQMKNRILVDILASGGEFSHKRYMHMAMQILTELADESDAEVAYLEQMMKRARSLGFKSTGMHDYRRGDISNLKHRKENAETVAADLRRRSTDEATLNTLVTVSQQAAWREVARNIEFNLDTEFAQVPEGVDEPGERADRIAEVIRIDLPRLERDQKRLQRRARAAAAERERAEAREAAGPSKATGIRGWFNKLLRR